MSDTVLKNGASQDETGDDAGMIAASTASLLCPEALKCMARISSLTDCTVITADGREFAVSKAIMAAHSEVLGNMFSDCSDQGTDHCRVKVEETSEEFAGLLNHAYAGSDYTINESNINLALQLAAKYDMPRLQRDCDAHIADLKLTTESLPLWINTASKFDIPDLLHRCIDFAAKHLQQIISHRTCAHISATDWLETLPQSTLVSILQARGGITAAFGAHTVDYSSRPGAKPYSAEELEKMEAAHS